VLLPDLDGLEEDTDALLRRLGAAQRPAWGEIPFLESRLYNMRHIQEHAAQLCPTLEQKGGSAPRWVTRAKTGIGRE
jgi:hypothetical protein